jgi:hypothetical protein
MKFTKFEGDWQELRRRYGPAGLTEIDFHRGRRSRNLPYMDAMAEVAHAAPTDAAPVRRQLKQARLTYRFTLSRSALSR